MSQTKFFCFGPLQVERAGRNVEIGLNKAKALLAYLVVTAQAHSREALVALFWPELDSHRARANLRRTLHRLTTALGAGLFQSTDDTVCISSEADVWLDVAVFQQAMRACLDSGTNPTPHVLDLLRSAVDLNHADFLAGFTLPDSPGFDEWQFFLREELRQTLARALLVLATAHQQAGAWEEAIQCTRRWLALDNLHEPAHRHLMQLYALAGQHAAALRQYEECVRILDQELGVAPEEETTALFERIRTRQMTGTVASAPPTPVLKSAHEWRGIQVHRNLPAQTTPFIGRARELELLESMMLDPAARLVTILGPGGIGKTRLAIQAADRVAEHFTSGVHFVPLQTLTSSQYLDAKLADSLQVALSGQTLAEEQLVTYLQDKNLLLVLDNIEHLLDRVGLLSTLLTAAPDLTLMVTSREVLGLQEEWVYPVRGMKAPEQVDEEHAEQYDAIRFFTERVRRVNPHFSLADERAAVIQICQLVEGVPLALELAASWAGALSCQAIAAEIRDNLSFLVSGLRNMPERHRSMRAVFEQSWNYLTQDEQNVFKQLSVFRGTFRRQAAEEVASATLPTLSALVNKSLLQWDAQGRYHLHELLRQYAEEHLLCSPQGTTVRDQHCNYFTHFLRQRMDEIHAGRQVEAMREMEADLDNLRAAWHWAVTNAKVTAIRDALHAIAWFWHYQSRYVEAADALSIAIQTLEAGDPFGERGVALAEVASQYGWICIRLGRLEEAAATLERAQALYGQLDVAPIPDSGTDPLTGLAMLTVLKGEFTRGIHLLQEARRQQEARGDQRNLYTSYYVLTSALVAQGDYRAAEQCARRAYGLAEATHDRWSMAYTLNDLGLVTYLLGGYEEAQQHYRASYAIRRQYNDREGMAVALRQLGQIALQKKDVDGAIKLFQESLSLYEGIGDLGGLAATLEGLGSVACSQGNYVEASNYLLQALQLAIRIQSLPLILSIVSSAAELLLSTDRIEQGVVTLVFVVNHPSIPHAVKARANGLLGTHTADMPIAETDWVAQGKRPDLATLTTNLQATLTIMLEPVSPAMRITVPRAIPAPTRAVAVDNLKQPLVEPLTPRETDVLQLLVQGLTNQEIAAELIVALGTVKAYTNRIYSKLGVQNRVQAVEQVRKLKLL